VTNTAAYTASVGTAEELTDILGKTDGAYTITLEESVEADTVDDATVVAGADITIKMEGNTITAPYLMVNGEATLENGTLEAVESGAYGARTQPGGESTFHRCRRIYQWSDLRQCQNSLR